MREEELLAKIEELRRIIEELEEENAALWEMLDEIEKSDKAASKARKQTFLLIWLTNSEIPAKHRNNNESGLYF
jgi:predicted ribosome quality control (RQC) complex YloA/Tae2 family protein